MTKEELEKATGQELIEQRDYCGVDGYYGDYLNDVNAEMLKRFNRLVDLEKENAELKEIIKGLITPLTEDELHLTITHAYMQGADSQKKKAENQLIKAKEIIEELIKFQPYINREAMFHPIGNEWKIAIYKARQFLKEE